MDIPYFLMSKEEKKKVGPKKLITSILLLGTAIGIVLGAGVKQFKLKR